MSLLHIVAMIILGIALYDDLRERKIRIIPAIAGVILGIILNVLVMRKNWIIIAKGCIPAVLSFCISKFGNECIGKGDSLMILCVGILHGYEFCLRFVIMSCINIFFFSCIMLLSGKLNRKSQVPCMPFMVIGYIGAWLL